MKKKIIAVSLLASVLVGGALVSCKVGDQIFGGGTNQELTSEDKVSLQAATGLKLLSGASSSLQRAKLQKRALSDTEIATLTELLPQLDFILENDDVLSATVEEGNFEQGGVTYTTKETITYRDSALNTQTYTLMYNVTAQHTEEEIDDGEVETETITRLEGVASFDNENFYRYESVTSVEVEGDETEEERYSRFLMSDTTYVLVEESFEEERNEKETEFEYTLVENGRVSLNYSIEIEKEWDEDSIEYEVNGKEYEVERLASDPTIYIVKVGEDDRYDEEVGRFQKTVDELGNVTFTYLG